MVNRILPGLAVSSDALVLHISEGLNLDPLRYMKGLWRACEIKAEKNSNGCYVILRKEQITSLSELSDLYDGVIICLGAGMNKVKEVTGKLPLTYCRGIVVHLALPPEKQDEFKFEGPSIVGDTWLAAQGSHNLVLGATKEWDDCNMSTVVEGEAAVAASCQLAQKAVKFYPPIKHWLLQEARAGVRAMTPRTPWGKVPLIGSIDELVDIRSSRKHPSPYYWIFGGLGSRGLIYHAWLAKKIAKAMVSHSEACLPKELLQWKL